MRNATRQRRVLGAMVVTAALLGACGGDDDDDDSGASADIEATAEDVSEGDADGSENPASADRCPLSAEQVSEALGARVEKDAPSCTFFPTDAVVPNATFVRQLAFACDGDFPAEVGYEEELDGLGVDAYVQPDLATGTQILVCTDAPFEIVIDMAGDSVPEIEAAAALAKLVLDS